MDNFITVNTHPRDMEINTLSRENVIGHMKMGIGSGDYEEEIACLSEENELCWLEITRLNEGLKQRNEIVGGLINLLKKIRNPIERAGFAAERDGIHKKMLQDVLETIDGCIKAFS